MQHRGATYRWYLLSLLCFRVRYIELLLKEVASKQQESRRTRPTTLDMLMMENFTEVAAGMLRTTTGSKMTHGKIGAE
jgi:hypothetical protein